LGKPLQESDLAFSQLDGSPLLPGTVSQAWRRLTLCSGLKGVRLHDAWHTHATLLFKLGIHPKIVQERLEHSSIAITLDTYSHIVPGLQAAAAKRFDELFDQRREDRVVERIRWLLWEMAVAMVNINSGFPNKKWCRGSESN
jgi:integrase